LTGLPAGGILDLMRERTVDPARLMKRWPRLMEDDAGRSESGDERGRLVEAACRTAKLILEGREDRDAVLQRRDPVPRSTLELLRGLARG
jgi:hypothetical protein